MTITGSDVARAVADLAMRLYPGAVSQAPADRLAASTDLWPRHLIHLQQGEGPELPAAVVWPQSVDDLVVIIRRARATGFTLVPYGAGSSVVGGATTTADQVVVDMKRMDAVYAIDGEGRTATAGAGIIGELFERQLNRAGLTQGHFPSSIYCSSLGGWIAARSAGQMSSRYGKIEDQVVGGIVVLGDGSVLSQPTGPVRAREIDELIGSEGTLGIWAQATVRVHPLAESRAFRGFDFPDLERALGAARAWLFAGLTPSVLRIYDPLDSFLHRTTHAHERGDRGANRFAWLAATFPQAVGFVGDRIAGSCRCILAFEGAAEITGVEMEMAIDIARRYAAVDLGPEAGEAWYATRYAISYRQSNAFRAGVAVDTMEVACPWEKVRAVYDAVRAAGLASGAQVLAHFSHVYLEGCSIYFTYALPIRAGVEGYRRLWRNALRAAVDRGANVSHHHGAGRHKAEALARALGGATRTVVELRRRFDPDRIMNPGVLVDQPMAPPANEPLAELPPADGFVCVAAPEEEVATIEERLRANGRTLGASAVLFGRLDILTAARRDLMWRVNPQLRIIEPTVWGVDASVEGVNHRFIPAPRSAVGPDLVKALLEQKPERLWLRSQPVLDLRRRFVGELEECVQAAADLAANPLAGSLQMAVVRGPDGGAALDIQMPDDRRTPAVLAEVERRMAYGCVEASAEPSLWPVPANLGDEPFFFACTWRALDGFIGAADLGGTTMVVPWMDAVGAAGFLFAAGNEVTELAAAHQISVSCDREAPRAARRCAKNRVPITGVVGDSFATPLRISTDAAALENCTYCPKLCRFSCPVAVAEGSETSTPRQLLLTANLDRTSRRALDADVAARFWSCVDCGSCRSFCEHDNDVAAILQRVRAQLLARGTAPPQVTGYLAGIRQQGRPPDRPAKDDAALEIATGGDPATAETWLFLGCQATREETESAARTLSLCRERFGPVHVLTGRISCCGHPLWRWGDRPGFTAHARAFASQLRGIRRLVVDDSSCAVALRELYPLVGVSVPEIVTTMELLRGAPLGPGPEIPWTIHHPCSGGRVTAVAEEIWLRRDLVAAGATGLVSGSVLEGEGGSCGGMLAGVFDPALAERIAAHAVADLLGGGAQQVMASSPACRRQLRRAGVLVLAPITLWRG